MENCFFSSSPSPRQLPVQSLNVKTKINSVIVLGPEKRVIVIRSFLVFFLFFSTTFNWKTLDGVKNHKLPNIINIKYYTYNNARVPAKLRLNQWNVYVISEIWNNLWNEITPINMSVNQLISWVVMDLNLNWVCIPFGFQHIRKTIKPQI